MRDDNRECLHRLRQQVQTDRLLGLDFVPIPRPQLAPRQRRAEAAPRRPGPPPAARPSAKPGTNGAPARTGDVGKVALLDRLNAEHVTDCRKCRLCETRTRTVFGQGNADARLMFVGEAPGFEEDRQGLAFVGKAGQLLTDIIRAMKLSREEVYICNVIKCRPPGNRDPMADEILACSPYLQQQIAIVGPEVIVALGSPAAKTLLNTADSIGKLRGRFHDHFVSGTNGVGPSVPLMPTYHPAYLLRNPAEKRKVWEDMKLVMARLGITLP